MSASNSRSNVFSSLTLFEMFYLQPVFGGHPVLSGHLAIPRGWPLITGSTVRSKVDDLFLRRYARL